MIYPQEIEIWYVLPTIRKELSRELIKRGLTQKDVALKLGLTEAAVSQYLKEKRATSVVLNDEIKKSIEKAAKRLMKNNHSMKEIERIVNVMRKNGTMCEIHHKYDKDLPEHCDICIYER